MGVDNELFAVQLDSDFVVALVAGAGTRTEIDFRPELWRRLYSGSPLYIDQKDEVRQSPTAQLLEGMIHAHPELQGLALDLGRGVWILRSVLGVLIDEALVDELFWGLPLGNSGQGTTVPPLTSQQFAQRDTR